MSSDFYRAFEDEYRGSRDLIRSRLEVYIPFITPLKNIYSELVAIDLGCGRGEWLGLLEQNGFVGQGVDINSNMLQFCSQQGFDVHNKGALAFLKTLPDESCVVISAFHLVEHISFEALQELVKQSLRVLKPSGLLILETPNPENIVVGTNQFYLDPTHEKPIPSLLLSFLPKYFGFNRTKVLGLQQPDFLDDNLTLMEVLEGVSPDYAVVAQKSAQDDILKSFDLPFQQTYGMNLADLCGRYEELKSFKMQELRDEAFQSLNEFKGVIQRHDLTEQKLQESQEQVQGMEGRLFEAEQKLQESQEQVQGMDGQLFDAEQKLEELKAQIQGTENRLLEAELKLQMVSEYIDSSQRKKYNFSICFNKKYEKMMSGLKLILRHLALYVSRRERLKHSLLRLLSLSPRLKHRLFTIIDAPPYMHGKKDVRTVEDGQPINYKDLTPRANEIYNRLKQNSVQNQTENIQR